MTSVTLPIVVGRGINATGYWKIVIPGYDCDAFCPDDGIKQIIALVKHKFEFYVQLATWINSELGEVNIWREIMVQWLRHMDYDEVLPRRSLTVCI